MHIDDPRAMRALAHPLRIELFERLAIEGSATATELAELVGATASNCSFHLRVLGEFGYIERVPGRTGRERPWRVVDVEQNWDSTSGDEETDQAARALSESFLEWEHARMRTAAGVQPPPDWRGKLFSAAATLHLTPDEAAAVGDRIRAIIGEYVSRWEDPDSRPEGSEPVRIFTNAYLVADARARPETGDVPAVDHSSEGDRS